MENSENVSPLKKYRRQPKHNPGPAGSNGNAGVSGGPGYLVVYEA